MNRSILRSSALLCLLAGSLMPSESLAQEVQITDLAAEAELHFQIAIDHHKRGRYQQALEHLLLSNRLSPNHNVTFNIARIYELLDQPENSYQQYTNFLLVETDEERREVAEAALERLAPKLSLVTIETDPPGVLVYVDRKDLGVRGQTPRTFAVPSETRTILLEREGYAPMSVSVSPKRGKEQTVSVELDQYLGNVRVVGSPAGAEIRLEGSDEVLGTIPATIALPAGPQLLQVSALGYHTKSGLAAVSLESETSINFSLDQLTSPLLVEATERGALVELDGVRVGYTPLMLDAPLGEHEISVSMPGFRTITRSVDVVQSENEVFDARLLPLQEVTVASGVKESLQDAPASMVVITAEDIIARGYTDLTEVIVDLPGFDVTIANGTVYMGAYQRGYRTPFTQRTLMMVNGIVDNHLWTHEATITRQYPISNIERVEVLYGPASAVYGPNAFLGIINIVTKDARVSETASEADVRMHVGSYSTRAVDGSVSGKSGNLWYSLSGRVFRSDEADLSKKWGFSSNSLYSDRDIWGPILDQTNRNEDFGSYQDPTDDWGVMGEIGLHGLSVGIIDWTRKEAYGAYYAADRAQNSTMWNKSSRQLYSRYEHNPSSDLTLRSLLLYRENRVWGGWAEGSPSDVGSDISYTHWNSQSNSWLFRQSAELTPSDQYRLQAGVKLERKELTKSYDIPGYWDGSYTGTDVEPGSGIGSSTDETYDAPPLPAEEVHPENLALTTDVGGFLQAVADYDIVRLNAGVRYDVNSLYGASFNPRASAIFSGMDDQLAIKAIYGEAFQEPAPIQLWGGWSGRSANPNLEPEKARNIELAGIFQTSAMTNELSAYRAQYSNVIKEEAENAGERTITGLEYRARLELDNPLPESGRISLYANYTFTNSISSVRYDHDAAEWVNGETALGDIAPHKANLGVTVPVTFFSAHVRGNWVSERELYTRNPLRADGTTLDPYLVLNGVLAANFETLSLSLKINNLLDAEYFHPGMESASAGDDFDNRSLGYQNSVIPQPGRSYLATARLTF